jgi:predicted nucleic acid-binding protein
LGVLSLAKLGGHLEVVRPLLERLLDTGFHLSEAICDDFLRDNGEL